MLSVLKYDVEDMSESVDTDGWVHFSPFGSDAEEGRIARPIPLARSVGFGRIRRVVGLGRVVPVVRFGGVARIIPNLELLRICADLAL